MSEELLQRDLIVNPDKIGKWDFYNIGSTSIKALKESNIIRNVDYGSIEKKKVDALIVLRKNVIAIIEYKKPSEFNTAAKQNKAIKQEIEVARKLDCKIIIATDTKETVWVNALTGNRIIDENGKNVSTNFNPKSDIVVRLIEKITYSINELNDAIKPKQLVNPTDLAKQIWQDIWSVTGATPENCLYTFVELFIFKYLSDLGVLKGIYSFETVINSFETNNADEILENYASVIRPKIKELFPENPIDKTTIINGTIFVSKDQKAVRGYSTVFKKVLLKFRDYGKLQNIDYDFKSQLFESFLKESISKKNWGQFFTPLKVVRAIVEMAKDDIKEGISLCDPACGVGKFLMEPIVTKLDYLYQIDRREIKPKITLHGYDKGFDKDEQKTIILAKANMLIYFSDLIREHSGLTAEFAKLFNETFTLKTNSILGTLSDAIIEKYDLILTNPPYVTSGSSNLKDEIKKDTQLFDYYKVNALGVEGLFMEWIIKALKPNGKAYIVIPDGMLNRFNDKNLRKYLLDKCIIEALISLPLNTFFTTNKKTYILAITKKQDKTIEQTTPVFTYLVSEIGETRDAYRFDIEQNDLIEATTLYSFFKGNKVGFAKINTDKRCKILPFNYFKDNIERNWVIDNLWTETEKIELGIVEKKESVSLFEFSSVIGDVAANINSLQEEIKALSEDNGIKSEDDTAFKEVSIVDDKFFELKRGKRITKKIIDSNKGEIPVYSSSKVEGSTLGLISEKYLINNKLVLFDSPSILFNLDGSVGHCFIRTDEKYSFIDVVASLRPKRDNIDMNFLLYELRKEIMKTGANYQSKLYFNKIRDYGITIKIPIDAQGNFDIVKQREIADKYARIEEIKSILRAEFSKVTQVDIKVE